MTCRIAQAALRRVVSILLGQIDLPDDVTPAFIEEIELDIGSAMLHIFQTLHMESLAPP